MKKQFTQGEWPYEGGYNSSVDIVLPNNTTITIDRHDRYTGTPAIDREEMEANARLVAAAPNMLEALERVLVVAEVMGLSTSQQQMFQQVCEPAIKKALGN